MTALLICALLFPLSGCIKRYSVVDSPTYFRQDVHDTGKQMSARPLSLHIITFYNCKSR